MIVLIIDDDAEDALLLQEVICSLFPGAQCFISYGFAEAKTIITESVPDYIFLDAMMYPLGGKETLMRLSQIEILADTKIIINSGLLTRQQIEEFTLLGADKVIQKSPDYHSLIATMKAILS
ncbi:MAG TPA: response regulator [Chryseosolibacter sp.]|nr:response regulator [Chryseosolibacter sp.]